MFDIVGREDELASVAAFVAEMRDGPAALVIEGDAGIGKSTLWYAAVEHARSGGYRVLSSRPAQADGGLPYAALGDLLEEVADEVLPALSRPRRRALEVAMLRDDPAGDPIDQRALAVAVRDVLQLLADRAPTLVAVDDVQWLDAPTLTALAFSLRRLGGSPLLLLLARRRGSRGRTSELTDAIGEQRTRLLQLGPLSVGALHQFLRDRFGDPFPRQTLRRIHEASGGNPFFALELARSLGPDVDPLQPLPVPETLDGLVRSRIGELPPSTREALAFIAALGTTSEPVLERAGVASEAIQAAVAARLIEREDDGLRFVHPLLASVLYADLGSGRRAVHARIARAIEDPILRARHLALSTAAPDAAVANTLDEASRLASDRGASATAAELAELARRLTPGDQPDQRRLRALTAARAHQAAGAWTRARAIAAGLLAETELDSWRAEALILLAELESVDRAGELLAEALREAAARPALQALIHCRLAWAGRFARGFDHGGAALELAEQLHDDVLRAHAQAVQAILAWFRGRAEAAADLTVLARYLPDALGGERPVQEATQAIVNTYAPATRRDEVRDLLEREYREWHERDEPKAAQARWGLAWIEFWAGRWELAAEHAAGAMDIAIQYGLEVPQDHLPIATVAAHRGQLELARTHSERALQLAEQQLGFHPPQHLGVLGLIAGLSGDRASAGAWFDRAQRQADALQWGEPSLRWWTADHVELLLEDGQVERALELLDTWQVDATRVARPWVLAEVTRCRGIAASAAGDLDAAVMLLEEAVASHEAVGDPYGRARALLALGSVRRRGRQKRSAREAMLAAREGFASIGAAAWKARADAELNRISGRSVQGGLTEAERRVARLAAEGRTNREIASALFLGERTIASHLTHVYAKLGVRSRTELARHLAANDRT